MSYALHELPLPRPVLRGAARDRAGIDVSLTLQRLHAELAGETSDVRRLEILAILHRWSWDRILSGRSRQAARGLLHVYRDSARRPRAE